MTFQRVILLTALFLALTACFHPDYSPAIKARAQIQAISTALEAYKIDTGSYPSTAEGLAALSVPSPYATNWKGPYLPTRDFASDPWGREYIYAFPGAHGPKPDIISLGSDGKPGGEGINADITSWTELPEPSTRNPQ